MYLLGDTVFVNIDAAAFAERALSMSRVCVPSTTLQLSCRPCRGHGRVSV